MLRIALLSARGRLATFAGAFVALFASAALVMAGGMPFEAALRTHPPVERYAGAAAVVTGQQDVGADRDVPLLERSPVSSGLVPKLAAVPGARAAIADVSAPARLGERAAVAHGWSSAALTPYVLTAGREPAGPAEVVTGYPAELGERLRLASTEPARRVTVVGVARPLRARRCSPAMRAAGRVSGAARGADDADRRHRVLRRAGRVHRDLRRRRHDGPVDPAARARDRAPAGRGGDARPDRPHDRLGGGDRGCSGRSSSGPATRPPSAGASAPWSAAIPACG